MTNLVVTITNKLLITAAYKYVATAVMLTNCNLFVEQTHLPLEHPINQKEVSSCNVSPPRLMGFGGSLATTNLFFGFGHNHLANFWQKEYRSASSPEGIIAQHERWSKMTSQVGTNEVQQLALNWLADLGVDVATLEQKYPCKITQRFFIPKSRGGLEAPTKTMLPIFEISWGSIPLRGRPEYSLPAVTMSIFGPTSELMEYHLYADTLMLRPKLAVNDYEKLLAIPNDEFKNDGDVERSNLLLQFTTKP